MGTTRGNALIPINALPFTGVPFDGPGLIFAITGVPFDGPGLIFATLF